MNKRWFAVVVLLLVLAASLLWWRLDVPSLRAAFEKQISHTGESSLLVKQVSLSLIHGIGLRLNDVTFNSPRLLMQARHVNISLHLLPLMFGKLELGTLDIHDAQIQMKAAVSDMSLSFAALPFERIQLQRSTIRGAGHGAPIENLQLDIRNIGPNREALWEISSRQAGYGMNGYGQLAFRAGEIMSGFGKLSLNAMPVSVLDTVAPATMTYWLGDQKQLLSGGLTLDISRHRGWSLFGEIEARRPVGEGKPNSQPVRLRGKISKSEAGELVWHDSFIHLQDQAVIALDGHCAFGRCEMTMDARAVPLHAWLNVLPVTQALPVLSGNTRLNAHLGWRAGQWQASGRLRLNHFALTNAAKTIKLPDIQLTTTNIHGNLAGWSGDAGLSFANQSNAIPLSVSSTGNVDAGDTSGWQLKMPRVQLANGVWQGLGNILLASLKLPPRMQGDGPLVAELSMQQQGQQKSLQVSLDADSAMVDYDQSWHKPAGVNGHCVASIGWTGDINVPDYLQLDACRLASMQLVQLQYQEEARQSLLTFDGLQLDMGKLSESDVKIPDWLARWQGRLNADGSVVLSPEKAVTAAHGEGVLQQFGTPDWEFSGLIKSDDKHLVSDHLQMHGVRGDAELHGAYQWGTRHGEVNILSAHLDWQGYPAMPTYLSRLDISGHMAQAHVSIAGYQLQDIEGDYRLEKGVLTMVSGKAPFADSVLEFNELQLEPSQGKLAISGKIKGRNLMLDQMPWISDWLHARVSGSMLANIELKGLLPANQLADWRFSNGDVTIYSGSWLPESQLAHEPASAASGGAQAQNQLPAERTVETSPAAASTDSPAQAVSPYEYRKLSFRFRHLESSVELNQIDLTSHDQHYTGAGAVSADGLFSGGVKGEQQYQLGGTWPNPVWQAQ